MHLKWNVQSIAELGMWKVMVQNIIGAGLTLKRKRGAIAVGQMQQNGDGLQQVGFGIPFIRVTIIKKETSSVILESRCF